ncbi:MAG: polysaccharide deacetylase family protein [Gaiellaceae bacterium]
MVRSLTLMYHAVSDAWDDSLAMPVNAFDGLLTRLVRGRRRGATASEIAARPGDPRLLHVTFDDAFASVQNALPTLHRLRIPATIFVCTDLADDGAPLAISELDRVSQRDELRTLDWDALRALADDDLIEIGSHTKTHAHLPQLSDSELRSELVGSKEAIEDHLGRPARYVAYPFGEEGERVRRAAEAAGYAAGFAAPGSSLQADPFRLPRTGLWRSDTIGRQLNKTRFALRLLLERRAAAQ